MTAPPGGPYGQDPSGANPYGQNPYWGPPQGGPPYQGGPPQGPPYQGGPPQGPPYQGGPSEGGPYQNPQGNPYQYPQSDPYANTQAAGAGPQAGGAYPPQQYPQAGQQFPGGWPSGPYPPGPPPKGPRSKTPWLIGAAIAVLAVVALVVTLVLFLGGNDKSTKAAPSTTTHAGPTSQPSNSQQNATDCTPNVSGGAEPSGDTISAGALSFPAAAAPGWTPFSDNGAPNAIDAVGVAQEVPNANQWMMQAEVATSNFVSSMDIATQASKLMTCIANGPGYSGAQPTMGPTKSSSITVDGTSAARVDADVTIGDASRNVKGDSVVVITVQTKPVTFFFGTSPIDDAASRVIVEAVIAALKVNQT